MKLSELQNLDFSDVGGWPMPAKSAAIIVIALVVLAAGYWFDTRTQLESLERIRGEEQELKTVFEKKAHKAVNLDAYKEQMEEIKRSFGAMLRQLPSKTEVAELLVDVSQAGLANGLEFELFKPESEVPAEFYAELPIKIGVVGNYHEFGQFVSDVAALPRIVTLHDFVISPRGGKDKAAKGKLEMKLTAKTYRYLEEQAGR